MSGGHWEYLSFKLEERAEEAQSAIQALHLLAAIEHEMDWGIAGDSCYDCAKLRVIAALEEFFNHQARDSGAASALARDWKQNRCERCIERDRKGK